MPFRASALLYDLTITNPTSSYLASRSLIGPSFNIMVLVEAQKSKERVYSEAVMQMPYQDGSKAALDG